MSDSLRDRIAAVLVGAGCPCTACTAVALEKADAVIKALALRQEYDPYSEPESSRHRYVTEWTADV